MTDALNLTEPGTKHVLPSPRVQLFAAIMWSLLGLFWLAMALFSEGEVRLLNIVTGGLFQVVAAMSLVQWRKSRKNTDGPTEDRK